MESVKNQKNVVIVGAGPAGLTAAYELLSKTNTFTVEILEESNIVGGISRTVNHNGNRMDMGGHRFFSKIPTVNKWWNKMLPQQGCPAIDDILLGRAVTLSSEGPDPEKTDRVMLIRNRVSRILFNGKFFDYPISLKLSTFINMGFFTTIIAGISYMKAVIFKREEKSLEDFYINRFGRKLYSMFFEHYTENLWGRHPSQIDPSWGAQRVKGVSIIAVLKNALFGRLLKKKGKIETSLIEEFSYPKFGPGQLWEVVAEEVEKRGGIIRYNSKVVGFQRDNEGKIKTILYQHNEKVNSVECDYVISSMPLKDLVAGMDDVPLSVTQIAKGLPYRDYMTVGVLVPKLNLKNKTKLKTVSNIVPDDWIYVHDQTVKMGRFQIYNNWSPYLVKDLEHTVWIGLEYFCNEGDSLWEMKDEDFSKMAVNEIVLLNLIDDVTEVIDTHVERVKKAYPAYFDTYSQIDELITWLDSIPNLFCVGRNGQHRYNNIDHSMCTSFEAVKNIMTGNIDKSNIWNVNTEREYHEYKN